ncbi:MULTISPECIES: hypothetical protein [Luteimonas]|uniref:hypothetical protein n=1 Tax=Luteimonas TaxID=83614 RepID=UPI000C79D888|nr:MULTISPECIES: hypothetical protein [Luteimonas]
MSQRAALAEIDFELHAAFVDAGLADLGVYWPPNSPPEAVPFDAHVYVDRDIQTLGDVRQAVAGRVEVAYVLSPLFKPEQGGVLVVDGDRYENAAAISDDGSLSRWMVRRARA